MKILLVEDDLLIADAIVNSFKQAGLLIEHVSNIRDARAVINASDCINLLVLDLNLPDGDGLSFLHELRASGITMPVLVLTARDETHARILGLDSGADDYLIKPFDMGELVARVRALQRRQMGRAATEITYGNLCLDPGQMQVLLDGKEVILPFSQFKLLQYLLESIGRVCTKQQIIDALYYWNEYVEENTIEVYISQLRKALWPSLIKTLRGIGYLIPKLENTP